jgi:hypothetical protein
MVDRRKKYLATVYNCKIVRIVEQTIATMKSLLIPIEKMDEISYRYIII